MKKMLIVNADDLGMTRGITDGILEAHKKGIVTSTSLMVTMPAAVYAANAAKRYPRLTLGLHGVFSQSKGEEQVEYYIDQLGDQLKKFVALTQKMPTHFDLHGVPQPTRAMSLAARLFIIKHKLRFRGDLGTMVIKEFYGMKKRRPNPQAVSIEALSAILHSLKPGITILVCHPGSTSNRLRDPYRNMRNRELDVLTSKEILYLIKKESIKVANFLGR